MGPTRSVLMLLVLVAGCGAKVRGVRVDLVGDVPSPATGPQVEMRYLGNGGWLISGPRKWSRRRHLSQSRVRRVPAAAKLTRLDRRAIPDMPDLKSCSSHTPTTMR